MPSRFYIERLDHPEEKIAGSYGRFARTIHHARAKSGRRDRTGPGLDQQQSRTSGAEPALPPQGQTHRCSLLSGNPLTTI